MPALQDHPGHETQRQQKQQRRQHRDDCLSWRHRQQQALQLRLLLSRERVPDILVHGPACTGKTAIVRALLEGRPHAYVSCSKGLKLRGLLGSVVAQIAHGAKRKRSAAFAGAAGSENSLAWELKAACPADQPTRVLVLDDVQRLLAASDGPLAPLLALREQAGANLSILLVSRAQPAALGLLGLLPGVTALPFPAYTESQLVDILAAAGPPGAAHGAGEEQQQQQQQEEEVEQQQYRRFLSSVLVPSFQRLSRCLPDLEGQAAALWPGYAAAARAAEQQQQQRAGEPPCGEEPGGGDVHVDREAAAYAAVRPRVQAALAAFQPAACVAPAALGGAGQRGQVLLGASGAQVLAGMELGRLAKLLLISAFLASRNKPSVDRQLFEEGGARRRGGGRRKSAMGADRQAENAKAAELKGPHTFGLARLLSVFGKLLAAEEDHGRRLAAAGQPQQQQLQRLAGGGWLGVQTADVLQGVRSLVAARLVTQACDDLLEGPRFGCEAPQELVQQVALDMGVPLNSYLKYV